MKLTRVVFRLCLCLLILSVSTVIAQGPSVVAIRPEGVIDITRLAPTMRDLCESTDPVTVVRSGAGETVGTVVNV